MPTTNQIKALGMNDLKFVLLDQVDPEALLAVVNQPTLRRHLIDPPCFDSETLQAWISEKLRLDAMPGYRVRAVLIGGRLAGWCGLQPDDTGVEAAIVISQAFWGRGRAILNVLIGWAKELGHSEIRLHLLDSRPEYRALRNQAERVQKSEMFGREFTTYWIAVESSQA